MLPQKVYGLQYASLEAKIHPPVHLVLIKLLKFFDRWHFSSGNNSVTPMPNKKSISRQEYPHTSAARPQEHPHLTPAQALAGLFSFISSPLMR